MSTTLEERLAAALQARAELVQPEDLQHQTYPAAARPPLWRRPVVVALVAAAAVVAVVVPLALRGHNARNEPLPPSDGIPHPVHSLSGDVDGDGKPDAITASGTTLRVVLAADPGHPRTVTVSHLAGLIGTAETGGHGRGIVVATDDTGTAGGDNWFVYALVGGGTLRGLDMTDETNGQQAGNLSAGLGVVPGASLSWITPAGILMTGGLDPSQRGQQHLAVVVSRYVGQGQGLSAKLVGRWCWDRQTQSLPAPCPAGTTYAFDPGPHGSLPNLLPKAAPAFILPGDTWRDGSTVLRLVKGTPHAANFVKQSYDVVGAIDGHPVSAQAGFASPRIYQTFVDLGHGLRGLVAVDDSKATWNLLGFAAGRLVPMEAPAPSNAEGALYLHPGTQGLIVDGTPRSADTWIGPDQQVFTRVETGTPGRYETYEWQVAGASATTVHAVDLGAVCIDDYWGTYGTCS